MGIHGLLPLLIQPSAANSSAPEHLSQFANCTLGIDGHGWLHKAIYGCATALALNQPTTAYLVYIARRLRLLQSLNISPLVVLDGAPPPLKSDTNAGRRDRRAAALALGRQLLARSQIAEADRAFQSAVGITPAIVHQLVSLLRHLKIQYIVAPYEADPQLVYLERIGRIDAILSEDSDLLVFGAQTLVTKWDAQLGTCQVIRAPQVFGTGGALRGWTRNMLVDCAILAGCDYLASAPGIGIKTAMRAVEGVVNADRFEAARARQPSTHTVIPDDDDPHDAQDSNFTPVPYRADTLTRAIRRLQFQSNKPTSASSSTISSATPASPISHLTSPTYLQSAIRARLAFRHGRVWCPFTRRLACLRPWPPAHERSSPGSDYAILGLQGVDETEYDGVGPWKPPEVAERVARGDVDPNTLQPWKGAVRRAQDERRKWDEIMRVVEQRPLSSGGPVVACGDPVDEEGEGSEHEEDVDVFVEFETHSNSGSASAESQAAAGESHDATDAVIPASDDLPRPPTSTHSRASHGSGGLTHLPSPPISYSSSSSDSSASFPDSIPASPTQQSHISSISQPRPAPRPPSIPHPSASTSQLHADCRSHHSPTSNLPSISTMRHLPTCPPSFQIPPSSSRKSTPSAAVSAAPPRRWSQYQPSLTAFMARKGSHAVPHGKENHAVYTHISTHAPAHAIPASAAGSVSKKRAWPTAALDPPVNLRVSGLFQAPRPTQEQEKVRPAAGPPPPVKRARNTR